MSSMTDIVFLLLVFFLLSPSYTEALDLILPKASGKTSNIRMHPLASLRDGLFYVD
jgi:biopolymer transport protein ExbD